MLLSTFTVEVLATSIRCQYCFKYQESKQYDQILCHHADEALHYPYVINCLILKLFPSKRPNLIIFHHALYLCGKLLV